ncbi:RNA-DNA hybrid ribonuclease Ecym_2463 [Eremothecium cymbalariae DBVPG|uniref:Ribonuclease H n=1 Tax=Eremothecium cymbalariae (strain CBS 270.75 / DBVPG 7215 / KCTC 17166 / NRRL Y-17582) TaxID=931890 RepID=G8JPT1_ERECY|nr:Hypothetical protein Ecym_2463 [Eremothecium cymbalariae DBVPG\
MCAKSWRSATTKFYGVYNGTIPGVYSNFSACKAQVDGVKGAKWGVFSTEEQAKNFVRTGIRTAAAATTTKLTATFYGVKSTNPTLESKVFETWKDCKNYVHRQRGLSFKKFATRVDAHNFATGTCPHDYQLIGTTPAEFTAQHKLPDAPQQTLHSDESVVYCDGCALGNGTADCIAGIGVYFANEPALHLSEPCTEPPYTNNRAEIKAAFRALQVIWNNLTAAPPHAPRYNYKLFTDSEYVVYLLTCRYTTFKTLDQMAKIPNADLAVPLVQIYIRVKLFYLANAPRFANRGAFAIEWVRGHVGEPGNEAADRLARQGATEDAAVARSAAAPLPPATAAAAAAAVAASPSQ